MAETYIDRRLAFVEDGAEVNVSQGELETLDLPLVILGDPGIGKTRLTEYLADRWGIPRISAGSFCRLPVTAFSPPPKAIIIDGLDELALSAGKSAVDEVLRKLALIGSPPFLISCRAADWNGAADRHKIREDYGLEPKTARLQPFNEEDAETFLNARRLDGKALIEKLKEMGLQDFYRNPLTLSLIAEIEESGGALPSNREALLDKASALLVQERNTQHQAGDIAKASVDGLLDAAGEIFAHILLSGSLGITDRQGSDIPPGYIPKSDVASLVGSQLADLALKSRLFQATGENLHSPYHRIIAEYLAGRWLARKLDDGLSERRAYNALTFAGGVPTALRGVHAWFGHFAPTMTDKCIRTDPYGALRYGDPSGLSLASARVLLQSLASLAEEDPYFRSEDWGVRAIGGLARPELKLEILNLLTRPDRPIHLSTLVLEALSSSNLTKDITPELVTLLEDPKAAYVERFNAGEAIAATDPSFDWVTELRRLRSEGGDDSLRLAIELAGRLDPNELPFDDLAGSILQYSGLTKGGPRRSVLGVTYSVIKRLNPKTAAGVLDRIASALVPQGGNKAQRVGSEMASTIFDLISRAIDRPEKVSASELWRWLKLAGRERGWNEEERAKITDYVKGDDKLRRQIQREAFLERGEDASPWLAVAMTLPQASSGLAVSISDAVFYLEEIATKPDPVSDFDIELWSALVRIFGGPDGVEPSVRDAAMRGVEAHPTLRPQWERFSAPIKRDWEEEENRRQVKFKQEKEQRFATHRQQFGETIEKIRSGADFGSLHDIAKAYLDLYYDLEHKQSPHDRISEWLGDELADASIAGLQATLNRNDIPTAEMLGQIHSEGRTYNAEVVVIAGVAENLSANGTMQAIPHEILRTALAAWNEMPEHYAKKVGKDLGPELEARVLTDASETVRFIEATVTPSIKAGKEYISHLYQYCRDEKYRAVIGPLALKWLEEYPSAHPSVQDEILGAALIHSDWIGFRQIIRTRIAALSSESGPLLSLWMGASFVADFEYSKEALVKYMRADKNSIWAIRNAVGARRGRDAGLTLSPEQLEVIIDIFGTDNPPVGRPEGGWMGDQNPWDAEEFINRAINLLGANTSQVSADVFERLATSSSPYRQLILHLRAVQAKARRDMDYVMPTFPQTRAMLDSSLPQSIDDLKAVILDALASAQVYLRTGDTMAWKAFWVKDKPADENTSRDRLLDILRGNLPKAIAVIPETRMPDEKRADMAAIFSGLGLPIDAKGQWHSEVWAAPSDQLIELYSKDYRAGGRGIYLVFWFGSAPGKNLPNPPGAAAKPTTPEELLKQLQQSLPAEKQRLIDVVVIDVSPTK